MMEKIWSKQKSNINQHFNEKSMNLGNRFKCSITCLEKILSTKLKCIKTGNPFNTQIKKLSERKQTPSIRN